MRDRVCVGGEWAWVCSGSAGVWKVRPRLRAIAILLNIERSYASTMRAWAAPHHTAVDVESVPCTRPRPVCVCRRAPTVRCHPQARA